MQDAPLSELKRYAPAEGPVFDPDLYNMLPRIFNCYAYALRLERQGWAHAGQIRKEVATGRRDERRKLTDFTLHRMLEEDGLERIRKHAADPGRAHVIAAFVNTGKGYHFFSLDRDNIWSHKPGESLVKRVRAGVKLPNEGDVSGNHLFVGYFKIPAQGIYYYPRLRNSLES